MKMEQCSESVLYTYLPLKMEQSVPKRQHIKFRRREITQKKTYNKVVFVQAVMAYGFVKVQLHSFLISALDCE